MYNSAKSSRKIFIMGKLKRGRKNQKSRHDPLKGKNGVKGDAKKDEAARNSKILPLIEKLSSSSANDRSMALGAITVLCEDDRMRQLLLKERLVPIIMEQCLNDNNDELVVEAFGLLRNIGIDEGYDIIKYLWRSNIWTPISASVEKISESYNHLRSVSPEAEKEMSKKKKDDEKAKQQLLFEFTEHILSLILVIASGSNELYDSVFSKLDHAFNLVIDLINFNITTNRLPHKVYNVLLDFLYEFSSESDEFVRKLDSSGFSLESVEQFSTSESQVSNKLGKCYAEGIKFHAQEVLGSNEDKHTIALTIMNNLFHNMSDIDLELIRVSLRPQDNATEPIQKDTVTQIDSFSEEKLLAKVNLQSIEIVVDLTTTIFEFLAMNDQEAFDQAPPELTPALIDLIFKVILPALVQLLEFCEANNDIILLTDKLVVCLNNLSWLILSVEHMPIEWFESSLKLWDIIVGVSHTDDEMVQKDCLSVLWAIVKSVGPQITPKIGTEMVTRLISKCDMFDGSDPFQYDYYLSIIGFVGSVAPIIDNSEMTYQISEFLLKTIAVFTKTNTPQTIELVLQSINEVFEIFADKSYPYDNEIYVQQNYNQKLKQLEPAVKEMYKKIDKTKFGLLKVRGEETLTNLGRFIQYKQNE